MKGNRKRAVLYYLLGVLLLLGAFGILSFFQGRWEDSPATSVAGPAPQWSTGSSPSPPPTPREENAAERAWYVYVTGEVVRPGVYEVAPGERLFVAVEKAGGFTLQADRERLNLAVPLKDAMHIRVPSKAAPSPEVSPLLREPSPEVSPARNDSRGSKPPVPSAPEERSVDVNSASGAELQELPGIGPVLSERILETRRELGRFQGAADLLKVPGIGAKRLEKMLPQVIFGP